MQQREGKRPVTVITACMTLAGLPDFALTEVEVTPDEFDNGVQYDLVETKLNEAGYEEPFVHFAEHEAPPFLVSAVKHYLGKRVASPDPSNPIIPEEP